MSHFPDREDPVKRFKENECVGCGRRAILVDREKFDYWLEYGYEKGYAGDESYLWIKHDESWRCFKCATDFHHPKYDG